MAALTKHNSLRMFFLNYETKKDFLDLINDIKNPGMIREAKLGDIQKISAVYNGDGIEKSTFGAVVFEIPTQNRVGVALLINRSGTRNGKLFSKERTSLSIPVKDVGTNPNPGDLYDVIKSWANYEKKIKFSKNMGTKSHVNFGILTFKDDKDIDAIIEQIKTNPKVARIKKASFYSGSSPVSGREPEIVVILIRNKSLLGIPKDAIVIFINTSIAGERLANRDYFTKNEKVIIPNVEMPGVTNKAKAIIKGINEFEKIESGKKSSKL